MCSAGFQKCWEQAASLEIASTPFLLGRTKRRVIGGKRERDGRRRLRVHQSCRCLSSTWSILHPTKHFIKRIEKDSIDVMTCQCVQYLKYWCFQAHMFQAWYYQELEEYTPYLVRHVHSLLSIFCKPLLKITVNGLIKSSSGLTIFTVNLCAYFSEVYFVSSICATPTFFDVLTVSLTTVRQSQPILSTLCLSRCPLLANRTKAGMPVQLCVGWKHDLFGYASYVARSLNVCSFLILIFHFQPNS